VAVLSAAHVPPTVHIELVATEPLRLMLPATHPLATGNWARGGAGRNGRKMKGSGTSPKPKAVSWQALAGERMLVLQEMHCLAGQVSKFCERAGVRPPVFMRGAQLSTVAAMVAAGLGVSVVPEMMCRAAAWPGCAIRPFAGESPSRDVFVARSLLRYRTNAARAFDELLRKSL
jgi:DNA-binding transcriptional LysR family regulator